MEIPDDWGDESFADDLNMWPGIVSGRVALLLRSTEIQPAAAPICPLLLADVGFSMPLQLAAKKSSSVFLLQRLPPSFVLVFMHMDECTTWDSGMSSCVWVVSFTMLHFLCEHSMYTNEHALRVWCGHTSANTPDPIRTPQLSALGPEQYWDG